MPPIALRTACSSRKEMCSDEAEDGLEHALQMTDEAAKAAPDLIILPECTYPAYYLHGLGLHSLGVPRTGPERSRPVRRPRPLHLGRAPVRPCEEVLALFADRAKRFRCYVAVGLVEEAPDGRLYNAAFLVGPDGRLIGKTRKQFMWHFDSRWFSPGDDLDVFPTPWGTVGMFICADARMPEIPRSLALKGARLLIDPTNLVSTGRDATRLTSAQVDYMLRARAIENRAWVAAANKVGMDEDSILYCGRSLVISPSGNVVAQASSDRPEVVLADICLPLDRTRIPGKAGAPGDASDTLAAADAHEAHEARANTGTVTPTGWAFDPLEDRRPATYSALVRGFDDLPVSSCLEQALVPEKMCPVVAALQLDVDPGADTRQLSAALEWHLTNLAVQGVDIVVLPEPEPDAQVRSQAQAQPETVAQPTVQGQAEPQAAWSEAARGRLPGRMLDCVLRVSEQVGIAVVVVQDEADGVDEGDRRSGGRRYRTAYYVDHGTIKAAYRKVHLDSDERAAYADGNGFYQVVRTTRGNFGIMLGCEGSLPEVARILTLEGADVILWPCRFESTQLDRLEWFARTRAAENRVFVVASNLVSARAADGDGDGDGDGDRDEDRGRSGGGGRGRGGNRNGDGDGDGGDRKCEGAGEGARGGGASLIVDPRGAVLAQAFARREQAIAATLVVADARCKEIVPGTDAIRARRPALYKALTE
ncbi:MAG: carbon-nitrogen hydrolase family protein [Bacillota bacterium]|nr:carbon-nitrogen hydrolase family protein [Bacillota bacterium]